MKSNRKILVVDDQEDLRKQVAKMLTKRSSQNETSSLIEQIRSRISRTTTPAQNGSSTKVVYEVDTVGQGQEAYELIKESFSKKEPYSLMFLDMRMPPGWDGLETAQRIRAIDKEIQIVIMTAYADYEQQEIAEKIGEPDKLLYIKKPFHSEEIRQLALAMTEKWNMNRRENERMMLTNRLMRENAYLTRHHHSNIKETCRVILDAFVSFLDADCGIMAETVNDEHTVHSASNTSAKNLMSKLSDEHFRSKKVITDDKSGDCFFPVITEGFQGFVYVQGKGITFDYKQLKPFLEILSETTREVVINEMLMQDNKHERQYVSIGMACNKVTDKLESALAEINELTSKILASDDKTERETLASKTRNITRELQTLNQELQVFGRNAEISHEQIDIKLLVNNLQESHKERLEGITVQTKLTDDLKLYGDSTKLEIALGHLIINAVEAINNHEVTEKELVISAHYCDDSHKQIIIELEDNGVGIPEEAKDIFDPFVSMDPDHHIGLGASIAKQTIEKHGGSISFESKINVGTKFSVELPVSPKS